MEEDTDADREQGAIKTDTIIAGVIIVVGIYLFTDKKVKVIIKEKLPRHQYISCDGGSIFSKVNYQRGRTLRFP